jgi:methyl-accepting chemotaxis protein
MNDEIASLEISDFANLEEYNARVQEIREKYFAQLELQESELNKAIGNNQELYETDWKAYSEMTGYKISADKEWINSFRETTLGYLTESKSLFSDFSETASTYADTLVESLSTAATGYFSQIEEALSAYGTSIANFGSHITGTYKDIQDSSDKTKDKTIEMAKAMKEAFEEVVNTVGNWQDTDGLEITEMLDKIATYLKEIFDAINTSANIKTDSGGSTIGQQEATRLLSSGFEYNGETYSFGSWSFNSRGDLDINDGNGFSKKGSNLVDYHAYLAE